MPGQIEVAETSNELTAIPKRCATMPPGHGNVTPGPGTGAQPLPPSNMTPEAAPELIAEAAVTPAEIIRPNASKAASNVFIVVSFECGRAYRARWVSITYPVPTAGKQAMTGIRTVATV